MVLMVFGPGRAGRLGRGRAENHRKRNRKRWFSMIFGPGWAGRPGRRRPENHRKRNRKQWFSMIFGWGGPDGPAGPGPKMIETDSENNEFDNLRAAMRKKNVST